MKKTTVYLEEETALTLRQLAKAEGRSQAELIREAVMTYAARAEKPRPLGIGAYRSGRSDVSERAEEILRAAAQLRR